VSKDAAQDEDRGGPDGPRTGGKPNYRYG
jgi:hypothetical protein